ncbi:hypothetical protein HHI36_020702 [Cryptolaemus montrouzieri]|uniref:SAP domain-containing protein n=1 Tax=Cryptolaemus montrouzieri TaxID=559131 RepID=A0ABD2NBB3_9CUCU
MSPTIDPSKLKVTELREELQARGLDTKGNKPVLVKRLKKALEEEVDKADTSVADTSTKELDTSRTEDETKSVDEAPERKESVDSRASQEQESEAEQSVNNDEAEDAKHLANEVQGNQETNGEENSEIQDTEKTEEEKQENSEEVKDVEMTAPTKDAQKEQKGEKRKRSESSVEPAQKRREKSPVKEDEPEIDSEKALLSWYDSDLHLLVDKQSFLSAKPIHEGLFGYSWAGVRATHGISSGKVRYEVKLTEELKWEDFTNQRRERQEKAKERKEMEKKNQQSKYKKSNEKKDTKSKEEKEGTEQKNETENDGTEVEPKDEKETETEKMETEEESPKTVEETQEKAEEEKIETAEDEKKESEEQEKKEESEDAEGAEKKEKEPEKPAEPILTHIFRAGWSLPKTSLQLGEDEFSYGYESTGKFVVNKEFREFGAPYKLGDVIGAYLNLTEDNVEMRYTVNGDLQAEVVSIPRAELPADNFVLFPHVLSRNFSFELNLGAKEEPWFSCPEELGEYPFLQTLADKVLGPTRPEKREDCEVVMMCGLPGSGKTHWVKEYLKENPDKRVTVIGCSHLLDKMTVRGQPLKLTYNGRWSILLDKLQRCLNRLADIAPQRRRNYIIDQTNVFPSAQRRKLRAFEGFKRRAVVVVVGDEEQAKRQSLKEAQDGKDVPDYAILEMKANMALPTKGDLFDEVIFTDLNEEEAKKQVTKYNSEGKAAGYQAGQKKSGYKDDRNRWNYKRNDFNRGGNFRDRGYQRYDRGPRGWGQPPPPGRFPRDRRPLPPPPMSGGREWMRNRGPPRSGGDRNGRAPSNFNRNRSQSGPGGGGGGRPGNWQSGGGANYGQGAWGGHQQSGSWGSSGGGWGGYQQQSGGNWNGGQWKQGGGYGQQQGGGGYGQNWNNYYGQYAQNWTGQSSY